MTFEPDPGNSGNSPGQRKAPSADTLTQGADTGPVVWGRGQGRDGHFHPLVSVQREREVLSDLGTPSHPIYTDLGKWRKKIWEGKS